MANALDSLNEELGELQSGVIALHGTVTELTNVIESLEETVRDTMVMIVTLNNAVVNALHDLGEPAVYARAM